MKQNFDQVDARLCGINPSVKNHISYVSMFMGFMPIDYIKNVLLEKTIEKMEGDRMKLDELFIHHFLLNNQPV